MLLSIGKFFIKLFAEIDSYRVMFKVLDSFVSDIGNRIAIEPFVFMYIIIDYTKCHNASFCYTVKTTLIAESIKCFSTRALVGRWCFIAWNSSKIHKQWLLSSAKIFRFKL